MSHNFNEQKYKMETEELQPIPTLGQYSENLINNELNFNNQFDNIPDFKNVIDYNDYLPDSKTSENSIINDLHKNSYKPGEPFMDKIYNFENNDLIDFSPDNKESSKKNIQNENREINNNTNDNLINIIDLENIQTSSTFDAGKTLENNNNILKDKDNNINNEEIDKILKNIENNFLNEDFGKNDYKVDNYANFEELPSLTEFEKGERQSKNMDLYTANEATNNDNYLSSTDNQNIDLYTSNEAFNDNYLISNSTDNQNNEPNLAKETFKDNDLLLKDNQNGDIYTQIETSNDNYLSSIDNQIIDTYSMYDKKNDIDNNYLTSTDNLNIDSDKLLNDIINGNYVPSSDNQTNQNLDSYLTNDIINNNYSTNNENIDQIIQNEIINDNNFPSTNNQNLTNETKLKNTSYPSIKEEPKYIGSKISNIKLPPKHLVDEVEHSQIKNIIIPYKKEIIIPVPKKIEVPLPKKIENPVPKKIQVQIPKTTSISPPKTEEILPISTSYVEPSPSLIIYDSPFNNNEFSNQTTFPEYNLSSENLETQIINNTTPVQVSSSIEYNPENTKISTQETYEDYSNSFNYNINSIPQKSLVNYNVGSPIKYNVSSNVIDIPVNYNISTYPLQPSVIYSPKSSPNKYNMSTSKIKAIPIKYKYNVFSQSNEPKLKYSASSGLIGVPRIIDSINVPLQSSNIYSQSSQDNYLYSSFKLNESHSYNNLTKPMTSPSKLYHVPKQKKSKLNYIVRTKSLDPSNKDNINTYSKETNKKHNLLSHKSTPQMLYNTNTSSVRYNSPTGYNVNSNAEYPLFNSLYSYNKDYNEPIYKSFYPIDKSLSPGIEISRVYSPLNNDKLGNSIYRPKLFRNKPKKKKEKNNLYKKEFN